MPSSPWPSPARAASPLPRTRPPRLHEVWKPVTPACFDRWRRWPGRHAPWLSVLGVQGPTRAGVAVTRRRSPAERRRIASGSCATARTRWHRSSAERTVAKCYRLLRAILNTAIEDRHLVSNPCTIKGAGVELCEERTIPTLGEVYALADAVAPRYRAFVLLAALGGLRRGELLALTRAD